MKGRMIGKKKNKDSAVKIIPKDWKKLWGDLKV